MSGLERRETIKQAAGDAYLLIVEVTKRGTALDGNRLQPIFKAVAADDAELDAVDDAAFWDSISYVAEVAKPQQLDTIRQLIDLRSPLKLAAVNVYILLTALLTGAILVGALLFLSNASAIQDKLARYDDLYKKASALTPSDPQVEAIKRDLNSIVYSLYERDPSLYNAVAQIVAPENGPYDGPGMFKLVTSNDSLGAYVRIRSKDSLQLIQYYWLPVFLALLGAMLSILRRTYISVETATVDILSSSMIALRLTTAAIAGIAIGWVYKAGGADQTVDVTPFLLAFVAGYSVDVVFSLLDRVTDALSDRPPIAKTVSDR